MGWPAGHCPHRDFTREVLWLKSTTNAGVGVWGQVGNYPGSVATGDDDWVEDYVRHAGTTPRIGRSEEVELCKLAQAGDSSAHSALFEANLRIVVSLAKRYGRQEPLARLLKNGETGLRTAIEQFDPSKGFHFPTYAIWWITQAMIQGGGGGKLNVREPKPPVPSSGSTSAIAAPPTDRRTGTPSLDDSGLRRRAHFLPDQDDGGNDCYSDKGANNQPHQRPRSLGGIAVAIAHRAVTCRVRRGNQVAN
jgi:hypothetical protein